MCVAGFSGAVYASGGEEHTLRHLQWPFDGITGKVDKDEWDLRKILAGGIADAEKELDAAIGAVSASRGALGASQNRFESIVNNLQVTSENLSASESRIRDTDMASEMVTFTKHQILLQAGTAMLAQANQSAQSVLRLLQ